MVMNDAKHADQPAPSSEGADDGEQGSPDEVMQALKFLQQQNREVYRLVKRLIERDLVPPAARPKFRRGEGGTIELWGGEGTGWIAYHGPVDEADVRH
jgi:hypothetical protein